MHDVSRCLDHDGEDGVVGGVARLCGRREAVRQDRAQRTDGEINRLASGDHQYTRIVTEEVP